jgi:ankyrin repeat protein
MGRDRSSKHPEQTSQIAVQAAVCYGVMKLHHPQLLSAIFAFSLMPVAVRAQLAISADGKEVTDPKTGLIWRRCAEGKVLSGGACTGRASTLTYKAALGLAAEWASDTGVGWRLPKVRELVSIMDPTIDPSAFPTTPSINWFWSGSTYADDPAAGRDLSSEPIKSMFDSQAKLNRSLGGSDSTAVWTVTFDRGQIGMNAGTNGPNGEGYVRLVRTAPAVAVPAAAVAGSARDLIDAASRGDIAVVQALLTKGADVDAKDNDGQTALLLASYKGNLQLVQLLLANGADVNTKANEGMTALMGASLAGSLQVVRELLARKAEVNAKMDSGKTALSLAANEGHIEVVKVLLDNGVDVNAKWNDGETALISFSISGHLDLVQSLLAKGAEIDARSKGGMTAMMFAAGSGHLEVLQELLAKGAAVDAKMNNGVTELMVASANGQLEVVRALLAKGADVNVKLDNGMTALRAATSKGHADVRALLVQAGAKP